MQTFTFIFVSNDRFYDLYAINSVYPVIRCADLKLLVVPGDDVGAAQLSVHAEGAHLSLQSVSQLLSGLQIPDEIRASVILLKPAHKHKKPDRNTLSTDSRP